MADVFLTAGRQALIATLKADPVLAAHVRTESRWIEFEESLWNRYLIVPSRCPFVAVSPATGNMEESANWLKDYPQTLRVAMGTLARDLALMEEMLTRVYHTIEGGQQTCFGLAARGLANVTCGGTRWYARPTDRTSKGEEAGYFVWLTATDVLLQWHRTQPHE